MDEVLINSISFLTGIGYVVSFSKTSDKIVITLKNKSLGTGQFIYSTPEELSTELEIAVKIAKENNNFI